MFRIILSLTVRLLFNYFVALVHINTYFRFSLTVLFFLFYHQQLFFNFLDSLIRFIFSS